MEKEKFLIGANTAKVVDVVLSVDNLSKQMGQVFTELYGENGVDEVLKEFDEAFTTLNQGLARHLGASMYEDVISQNI